MLSKYNIIIPKKNKFPIAYLSIEVKYGTGGIVLVIISRKLTCVRIKIPATVWRAFGSITSTENGTKPSAVIKNISVYALDIENKIYLFN